MLWRQFCLGNNLSRHIRENTDFLRQKPRQLLSAKRISKAASLIKNAKVSEVQLDESLFKVNEGSIQGCQVQRKKMCDNELFPKDSLSFVSPGGPPLLCLSWGATKIFKIDTSRLLENDLPRTFLIYPLTVRDNWKLGYIRGFIS